MNKNYVGTHYPDGKGGYRFAGQPRETNGKWKRKSRNRLYTIILLSFFLIFFAFQFVRVLSRDKVVEINEPEIFVDNLPIKIQQFKNELLDTLKTCESNGYNEDDALIVYDSNKQFSLGVAQFQIKTVQHYFKTLYAKEITRKEAVLIALDEKQSIQLASDIIFKTPNGLSNWLNCSKKHNLTKDLEIIKKLES